MNQNILIADSGSTKADWRLLTPQHTLGAYVTLGLNPYLQSDEELFQEMNQNLRTHIRDTVDEIYFYGAGVSTDEKAELLVRTLRRVFPKAKTVEAYSDLFGAARALCGTTPGIVCIFGTGSNSCLYDGQTMIDNIPPCGYVLGDEGSGAVLGKKLLSAFLKRGLTPEMTKKLCERYHLTKDEILERVYKTAFPNRYLAGFTVFMRENIADESIARIIETSFEEFIDCNVARYSEHRESPIHFSGSVAFHFRESLKNVLHRRQLQIGRIIQAPANDLAEFHKSYASNKK